MDLSAATVTPTTAFSAPEAAHLELAVGAASGAPTDAAAAATEGTDAPPQPETAQAQSDETELSLPLQSRAEVDVIHGQLDDIVALSGVRQCQLLEWDSPTGPTYSVRVHGTAQEAASAIARCCAALPAPAPAGAAAPAPAAAPAATSASTTDAAFAQSVLQTVLRQGALNGGIVGDLWKAWRQRHPRSAEKYPRAELEKLLANDGHCWNLRSASRAAAAAAPAPAAPTAATRTKGTDAAFAQSVLQTVLRQGRPLHGADVGPLWKAWRMRHPGSGEKYPRAELEKLLVHKEHYWHSPSAGAAAPAPASAAPAPAPAAKRRGANDAAFAQSVLRTVLREGPLNGGIVGDLWNAWRKTRGGGSSTYPRRELEKVMLYQKNQWRPKKSDKTPRSLKDRTMADWAAAVVAQAERDGSVDHASVLVRYRAALQACGQAASTPFATGLLTPALSFNGDRWVPKGAAEERKLEEDEELDEAPADLNCRFLTPDELAPEPLTLLDPDHERAQAAGEMEQLLSLLPPHLRACVHDVPSDDLLEIVLDVGDPATLLIIGADGQETELRTESGALTIDDVNEVAQQLVFGPDDRAVIDGSLHRIAAMRDMTGNIYGLTMRVGRAVFGSLDLIRDLVHADDMGSVLLLGSPGVGKTVALREFSRIVAEKRRVIVVDTSNEIAGGGMTKHRAVGNARRMMVPPPAAQHTVMIRAVENHNPRTVVIDEIGSKADVMAAATIAQRGVQLIGTAHGIRLVDLVANPDLAKLTGGATSVILSAKEAEKQQQSEKLVRRRAAPPVFDTVIELRSRDEWVVIKDVGAAVDRLLSKQVTMAERRVRLPDGRLQISHVELECE